MAYKYFVRMLYTTFPQLPQHGLPDWQFYVYVVEVNPDGETTQHMVTSRQANDHAALALRRGYDELFFLRHEDRVGQFTAKLDRMGEIQHRRRDACR